MSALAPAQHQPRLLPVPPQGARDTEAHRVTGDVLARLSSLAHRCHKALTPHSRQQFERVLHGERHLHVFDLAFALQALDAADREWLLEPLMEAREAPTQSVVQEIAEAIPATSDALASALMLVHEGTCSARDIQAINAKFHTAQRELGDVVRALRQA